MAASLAERILPHIDDDFARGQAYGVIYLLRYLDLRTDWSDDYLEPQWLALQATTRRVGPLLRDMQGAPSIEASMQMAGSLRQRCDAARAALCTAYDWAERHAGQVPDDALQALRVIWQDFIEADLKHELSLRLALPYSEMSTGRGTTDASLKESP
ncbi:MAG TPA: hypothetical protein VGH84_06640 [Steroidobacteraceae bacterium]